MNKNPSGNHMERIIKPGFSIILIIILAFSWEKASSQDEQYSEEITVIAPYKPTISEAFKLNINPRITLDEKKNQIMDYSILPRLIPTYFEPEPIKPVKIVGEPLTKLYRNLVKVGIGNYKTPYFEFFANNLRSKKHAFGVHLKHLSSGDIKNYPASSQSSNIVDLTGKKFFKNHTLAAKVLFDRHGVYYYGYDKAFSEIYDVSKDSIKQTYTMVGADIGLGSNYVKSGKFNHNFDLHYHWLFDHNKSTEHNVDFTAKVDKTTDILGFSDEDSFGLELETDFYRNSDSIDTHNTTRIGLIPFFGTTFNEYSFYIGVIANFEVDSVTKVYVRPLAEIRVNIIKEILNAYIGVSGGLQRNSFKTLSDQNPFITSVIPMRYTEDKFRLYGGINARAGSYFDFNLSLESRNTRDMPFFVNDTSTARNRDLFNQFTVVYDDAKEIHGAAEIVFHKDDKINIIFRGNYYQYTMDSEKEPWHKPKYDLSLTGKYSIQEKFLVGAGIIAYGKYAAKTYEDGVVVPEEVKGFADVNLGLEYRYSKNLSGFLNLNNITNNQYFRWYNYASQRFNFLIGASYSF